MGNVLTQQGCREQRNISGFKSDHVDWCHTQEQSSREPLTTLSATLSNSMLPVHHSHSFCISSFGSLHSICGPRSHLLLQFHKTTFKNIFPWDLPQFRCCVDTATLGRHILHFLISPQSPHWCLRLLRLALQLQEYHQLLIESSPRLQFSKVKMRGFTFLLLIFYY